MNYDEFKKIVKGMKSIWPKHDFIPDRDAFNIWYELLKDLSYENCMIAVKRYASLNTFPPSVAEIREQSVLVQADIKDWSVGWQEVTKAIGRHGYQDESGALADMDEITAQVVKRLGWKQICMANTDEMMAIRANFRKIYEHTIKTEKEQAALPVDLKEAIARIGSEAVPQLGGSE